MSYTPTEITSINALASRHLVLHHQPERTVTTMHPLIGTRVRYCHMACLQWCPAGGWAGCLPVSLASINCSLRLAYQTVALTGVEVRLRRAVRRRRNLTSIVGHSTKLLRALGRKPAGSTPGSCPAR
jgi:hypothetical protein